MPASCFFNELSLFTSDAKDINKPGAATATTEMSEQPLAHPSQTGLKFGLQELNNLGYSLAVTTNKHS